MTKQFSILALLVVVSAGIQSSALAASQDNTSFEKRCGWYENPTPANSWLLDRDGEWTISVQDGTQAEDETDWTDFKPTKSNWVKTNGEHGYGCACITARVDVATHTVLEIKNGKINTLLVCRQDKSLPKP